MTKGECESGAVARNFPSKVSGVLEIIQPNKPTHVVISSEARNPFTLVFPLSPVKPRLSGDVNNTTLSFLRAPGRNPQNFFNSHSSAHSCSLCRQDFRSVAFKRFVFGHLSATGREI